MSVTGTIPERPDFDKIARLLGWDEDRKRETIRQYEANQRLAALAKEGRAPAQCPDCGSYNLDGRPPALHLLGCSRKLEITINDLEGI